LENKTITVAAPKPTRPTRRSPAWLGIAARALIDFLAARFEALSED